jgi:hypothetical protein
MRTIPLQAVANQSVVVTLDEVRWTLTIKACDGIMAVDVDLNDTPILRGQRVVAGLPVIPYRRLIEGVAPGAGNFMFVTVDDAYPWWERFGVDQSLVYVTAADLE